MPRNPTRGPNVKSRDRTLRPPEGKLLDRLDRSWSGRRSKLGVGFEVMGLAEALQAVEVMVAARLAVTSKDRRLVVNLVPALTATDALVAVPFPRRAPRARPEVVPTELVRASIRAPSPPSLREERVAPSAAIRPALPYRRGAGQEGGVVHRCLTDTYCFFGTFCRALSMILAYFGFADEIPRATAPLTLYEIVSSTSSA